MTITTILKYLCGNRQSILRIAASHDAIWVGGLLVLSAGLAREYDGEDLWHQPWHLLLPPQWNLTAIDNPFDRQLAAGNAGAPLP